MPMRPFANTDPTVQKKLNKLSALDAERHSILKELRSNPTYALAMLKHTINDFLSV